jgi:hypothetical protein
MRENDGVLVKYETTNRELAMLRELMEARGRLDLEVSEPAINCVGGGVSQTFDECEEYRDDDARSIKTIVPRKILKDVGAACKRDGNRSGGDLSLPRKNSRREPMDWGKV